MLAIDPNKRPLAKGALAHEYFTDLPEQMRPPISEPKKNDAFFDFEKENLTKERLQELIFDECCVFHPEAVAEEESRQKAGGRRYK